MIPEDLQSGELRAEDVRSSLSPVEYILVKGRPLINDYTSMISLMKNINEIQLALVRLGHAEEFTNTSSKNARDRAKREVEQSIQGELLDQQVLKDLMLVMDTFYRGRLVIKVLPYPDARDIRVVAPLHETMLRDPLDHLRLKFGMAPNAEWTMFGQIAAVPEDGPQASPFEMYFSNEIEGALEKIFGAMRGINALLSVSYPEIAITPIAIYRE
jgi:hypothetical protein